MRAVFPVVLDTLYHVETPEGIELQARLAGPVSRILAFLLDIIIRLLVLLLAAIVLLPGDKAGMGVWLILAFLLEWLYPVFFEQFWNGQTPGKRVLGLTVIHSDLTPISWSSSFLRNLLRAADFLPLFFVAGVIAMLCNRHFQRLGDLVAGTLVIYQKPLSEKLIDTALPAVKPQPPPVAMTLNQQIAVMSFVQRSQQLSQARQQELANVLIPITPVSQRTQLLSYWQGVALWLMGKR